jgi:hypothetical protein
MHSQSYLIFEQENVKRGPKWFSLVQVRLERTCTSGTCLFPGKGSLDHPSSGLGTKAFGEELLPVYLFALIDQQSPLGNGESLDRLNHPSQRQLGPGAQRAVVVAVSPDQLETGKLLLQWL